MLKQIPINVNSLLKSGLLIDQYLTLWLLYKKEYQTLITILDTQFGLGEVFLREMIEILESGGWVKVTSPKFPDGIQVREQFIECLNLDDDEILESEVESWIDEYRGIFKGKRVGSMGDRAACVDKMTRFLSAYDQFTKADILEAAKLYVQSQAPSYKYLMQADYFVQKKDDSGNVTSKLHSILEDVAAGTFNQTSDFSQSI
jgi:hypothetical protein